MPANVNFTEFTDEEVFMEDREAANTFFENMTVPDATTASYGVVKKSTNVASIAVAYNLTAISVQVLDSNNNIHEAQVVLKTEVDTALNALRTKINDLLTKLAAAGVME